MKNSKKDEKVCALIDKFVEVRKEKGFTQANLAEKSGYSQQVISRIEKKTNIPQINTLYDLVDVLGHEITYKPKGTATTVKKQEVKPVVTEIDLSDIPDDSVITYTELKEYIDSDEGEYYRKKIKGFERYFNPYISYTVDMSDAEYNANVLYNSLIEIREMFNNDKISEKRLERIKDDLIDCKEFFQDIVDEIEYIAEFGIEDLVSIIDDINNYDDDEIDDDEE